jgi:hypothetical protein
MATTVVKGWGSAQTTPARKIELVFQEEPLFNMAPGCTYCEAMDDEKQPSGNVFDCVAPCRVCRILQL